MVEESTYILIVDKLGIIGNAIIESLGDDSLLVYVGTKKPFVYNKKIHFLYYKKKFPLIPAVVYSHIYIVYNGEKEVKETFFEIENAAVEIKAHCVFIIPHVLYEKNTVDKLIKNYSKTFVFVVGDLLDDALLLTQDVLSFNISNIPLSLLFQVWEKERVVIPENAVDWVYPVLLEDVIAEIIPAALEKKQHRVFCVFPKHPPTILSFIRMLQKANPFIKVDFSFQKENLKNIKNNKNVIKGEYIALKNDLEKKIKILFEKHSQQKPKFKTEQNKTIAVHANLNARLRAFQLALFLFFMLVIPVVAWVCLLSVGGYELLVAKHSLEKTSLESARKSSLVSQMLFRFAKTSSQLVLFESGLVGRKEWVVSLADFTQQGEEVSSAIVSLADSLEKMVKLMSGKTDNSVRDFQSIASQLKHAFMVLQKLKAEGDKNGIVFNEMNFTKSASLNNLVSMGQALLEVMPNVMGFDRQKRYALLFQNNMELRPGGGFIGSYGMLVMRKGKVVDFSIHDVYDADGQLKGHIEPPYPIRRHLPSPHWFLRDSNFDIDFVKSASQAAFFLRLETGKDIDGVISIDVSFIKEILQAIGPVYVSGYKEKVTADNVFLLTQSHAEKNFFPGSSQKKDFLTSLLEAMQASLVSPNNNGFSNSHLALLDTISNSLSQKHILFASSDQHIQDIFNLYGMSSSFLDNRAQSDRIINDFLGINEANLGVNKANYFVKRKVDEQIILTKEGSISARLTVSYKNLSKKNEWPGGDYKNYLRFLLPAHSKITSIIIDGKEQKVTKAITDPTVYEAKNFTPKEGLEVETTEEDGKALAGFLVTVPIGLVKTIQVNYSIPQTISFENNSLQYSLFYFKQPGTDEYPFSFSLSYPKILKVLKLPEEAKDDGEKISFSKKLLTDHVLEVQFSR